MRGRCRTCLRDSALTVRGRVWHHHARGSWGNPLHLRCPGAGHPPVGVPDPAEPEPLPGQGVDTSPLTREYGGQGTVYLLCFREPFSHARHYLGWASPGNLGNRLYHHSVGSGANLLAHVGKAGIGWDLARTWPGDRYRERQLKARGQTRACPRCRPELRAHLVARSGEIPRRATWTGS